MSSWAVRWNPWSSNYSSLECEQMRFIHKTYCEAMEPLYKPSISDMDPHTFMRKLQDVVGLLRSSAECIIATICAYQKYRNDRSGLFSYTNDPRTLLLEEFKHWALNVLAPASCTTEATLVLVKRRHNYLLRLQHGQQRLFQSGSGEKTLMSTLREIRQVIEVRILPTIETERAHSSAREQLHTLEARSTDGLLHVLQFLFFSLRNTPNTPDICTVNSLQNRMHNGMEAVLESKSGKLLELLVSCASFRELFPEGALSESCKKNIAVLEEKSNEGPVFLDNEMNSIIPPLLTGTEDAELSSPVTYLKQNSGLVSLNSESDQKAYDDFVRLHAMLKLLADLIVSCRKARQLAGPGGDLLVYGPGGEEVRRLVQSFKQVQEEILHLVDSITRIGIRRLDHLKARFERTWRDNFSKVLPLENYISHDFQACVEPIQRIYAGADPVRVNQMYREFRQATGLWVKENFSICHEASRALGVACSEEPSYLNLARNNNPMSTVEKNEEYMLALKDTPREKQEKEMRDKFINTVIDEQLISKDFIAEHVNTIELEEGEEKEPDPASSVYPPEAAVASVQSFVSWATGKSAAMLGFTSSPSEQTSASEIYSSETVENQDELRKNDGVLDALLLTRKLIQRISQLSWTVKSSVVTAQFDESEVERFVALCAVYNAVGVETADVLFLDLKHHMIDLNQWLRLQVTSTLRCIFVLQQRVLEMHQGFHGAALVLQRLEKIFDNFLSTIWKLKRQHEASVTSCNRMKAGILEMPDLVPVGDGLRRHAFHSISTFATTFGRSTVPSAALLSHTEYIKQLCFQLDLHQSSLQQLEQSVTDVRDAIQEVLLRFAEFPKTIEFDAKLLRQQVDYIFEFNYDRFFHSATNDLKLLVIAMSENQKLL